MSLLDSFNTWLGSDFKIGDVLGAVGDVGQAGLGAYSYYGAQNRLDDLSGDIKNMFTGARSDAQQGDFTGFSMRSGLGSSGFDTQGNQQFSLDPTQQQYSDTMRTGALDMYNRAGTNAFGGQAQSFFDRAAQDPAQRESDIYERIRAMQAPGEERQRAQMTANLFGSGRGGMGSGEFGASPEEFGFNMARNEAMNQASFQAIDQGQREMMNYQQMGQGLYGLGQQDQGMYGQLGGQMGAAQYDPYQQLMAQNAQAMQGGQMMNQSGQALAGLMTQLGIGEATTAANLGKIEGENLASLLGMFGQILGGLGGNNATTTP